MFLRHGEKQQKMAQKSDVILKKCSGQYDVKKLKFCVPFPKKVRKFDGWSEFPYNVPGTKRDPAK